MRESEWFEFTFARGPLANTSVAWNITSAWAHVLQEFEKAGENMVNVMRERLRPIELDDLKEIVAAHEIIEEHVDHVDSRQPGLAVRADEFELGAPPGALIVIDGHHRAARALREGRRYGFFVLTDEESKRFRVSGAEMAAMQEKWALHRLLAGIVSGQL